MRKIEQQMLAAIRARKNWRNGNTEVSVDKVDVGTVHVHLFGHLIASIHPARIDQTAGIAVTLAGWNTPTTRSRLNAILREVRPGFHGIGTKLGQAYYFRRETLHGRDDTQKLGDREWLNISGEL